MSNGPDSNWPEDEEFELGGGEKDGGHDSGNEAPKFSSLEEAAEHLDLRPADVMLLREQNKLRGFIDGATWKFKRDDVNELAKQRERNKAWGDEEPLELEGGSDVLDDEELQDEGGSDIELGGSDIKLDEGSGVLDDEESQAAGGSDIDSDFGDSGLRLDEPLVERDEYYENDESDLTSLENTDDEVAELGEDDLLTLEDEEKKNEGSTEEVGDDPLDVGVVEGEESNVDGENDAETKNKGGFRTLLDHYKRKFLGILPTRKDVDAFIEKSASPPPWGNSIFHKDLQVRANELQYGQSQIPETPSEQDALCLANINRTVSNLPSGDTDEGMLRGSMRLYHVCVSKIIIFANALDAAGNFVRTNDDETKLNRIFEEMITAIEAMKNHYDKYIKPNQSIVDSATERMVLESRLLWMKQFLDSLKSNTFRIWGVPIIPLLLNSYAQKSGSGLKPEMKMRQDTVQNLSYGIGNLHKSLIKKLHEKENIGTQRRILETMHITRNAAMKLLLAGIAGVGIWGASKLIPSGDGPDAPPEGTAPAAQPDNGEEPVFEEELSPLDKHLEDGFNQLMQD
ncbi:MAG: hypothetical protein K9M03_00870 [Kiritimatiellales bacterium]|nr:hypothetical protein [Kiritimatiellales bacterium]